MGGGEGWVGSDIVNYQCTCFFYMALGLNDFDAGKSITRPLEAVGHENLDFFRPKWHSLCSLPFQDPKKSRFSGPIPSNGPRIGCCCIKIITGSGTGGGGGGGHLRLLSTGGTLSSIIVRR